MPLLCSWVHTLCEPPWFRLCFWILLALLGLAHPDIPLVGFYFFGALMRRQYEKPRIQKEPTRQLQLQLSLASSRALNRRSENVIVKAIIIPELELRNVKWHVFGADLVERVNDPAILADTIQCRCTARASVVEPFCVPHLAVMESAIHCRFNPAYGSQTNRKHLRY